MPVEGRIPSTEGRGKCKKPALNPGSLHVRRLSSRLSWKAGSKASSLASERRAPPAMPQRVLLWDRENSSRSQQRALEAGRGDRVGPSDDVAQVHEQLCYLIQVLAGQGE